MNNFRPLLAVFFSSLMAVSCGGGSDGPAATGAGVGQAGAERTGFSVSGLATVGSGLISDSDTNDPYAYFSANDTAADAQPGPNPGIVLGYLSAVPYGPTGSRFANQADTFDTYKVSLAAGQRVAVQMAGWDPGAPGAVNINLFLFDMDKELRQVSESIEAVDALVVQTTGEYYVVLGALAGASNYTLRISSGESAAFATTRGLSRLDDFIPGDAVVAYAPQGTARNAMASSPNSSVLGGRDTSAAVLVRSAAASAFSARSAVKHVDEWSGLPRSAAMQAKIDTIATINALRADATVRYAEPNYRAYDLAIPNDELYPYQWHYPKIKLPQAWDITEGASGGEPVIVAVVDTGVILQHPDMLGQTVPGFDFVSDPAYSRDGDGIDSDPTDQGTSATPGLSSWHGTHVSATVAARSNDGSGVAGVAPLARVMPLRALGLEGGSSYDIAQAIRFAAGLANDSTTFPAKRADIINLSLGGATRSAVIAEAVLAVQNAGVVVVAAAGNDGSNAPMYPASLPGVISVSATTLGDERAPYSNYGVNIDISAPGGNTAEDLNADGHVDGVLSAVLKESGGEYQVAYKFLQGTSMAAPHVAGVLALMKAANPTLTAGQINTLLLSGEMTDDLGPVGRDDHFGQGVINAYKSVLAAQSLSGITTPDVPRLISSRDRFDFGKITDQLTLRLESSGGEVTVSAVASAASWLHIATAVSSNGGLEFVVSVDRGALSEGVHRTTLTVDSSAGQLQLAVTVDTTTIVLESDAGQIYFLLFTTAGDEVVAQFSAAVEQEAYSFNFDGVPAGSYYLVAGSDQDNDGYICGAGEACGGWPVLSQLDEFEIVAGRSDVAFLVGHQSSLGESLSRTGWASRGYAVDKAALFAGKLR